MRGAVWMAVLALAGMAGTTAVEAQGVRKNGWQLTGAVGPYRIDDLAGTPIVPSATLTRAGKLSFGATLWWIDGAGRYTLTALAADLDLGVRFGHERVEGALTVGPSALLGGDSDGTPYLGAGGHTTLSGLLWISEAVGVSLAASARAFVRSTDLLFTPSLQAGIRVRL